MELTGNFPGFGLDLNHEKAALWSDASGQATDKTSRDTRIAEPHDFGVIDGEKKLFFYQVGGTSRSGRPLGWRWAVVARIAGLRLLDDRFPGPRATPSGRHQRWDVLYASVSRPATGGLGATRS